LGKGLKARPQDWRQFFACCLRPCFYARHNEMLNQSFTPGQDYTRRQIHRQLGGSFLSYLPTVDSIVVCACLRTDLNRKAPEVIIVGHGSRIERAGELLSQQTTPIAVFVKRAVNRWTYRGMWKVRRSSQLPQDIDAESGTTRRGTVSRVIFMQRVNP
jgi:hypothetical protein